MNRKNVPMNNTLSDLLNMETSASCNEAAKAELGRDMVVVRMGG